MDDPFKRLKKTLFNLYRYYYNEDFLFIGATIGRVTFKKFFQLVDDFDIERNVANNFLVLQLKHYDYKQLPYSDDSFSHADAANALQYLKRATTGPQLLAFIFNLHKKNDDLKKWFAPLPVTVPRLTFYLTAALLKKGLKNLVLVRESWARDYFHNFYHMSDEYFDKFIRPYTQLFSDSEKPDDGFWFDLCDLAEIEQIFIDEKSPPASAVQRKQLLEIVYDGRNDEECLKMLKTLNILDPNRKNLLVKL